MVQKPDWSPAPAEFQVLEKVTRAVQTDSTLKQQLVKWGLLQNLRYHVFRYDASYHSMQAKEFLHDFFNDSNVKKVFQVAQKGGGWMEMPGHCSGVQCEVVAATTTRMDIFDKLREAPSPILRESTWHLMRCFDDECDGFAIQDRLREFILKGKDSENVGTLSDEEQGEFLWRLFTHLALGGALNQFEDSAEAYMQAAKILYKDLLCVQKNPATGKIEIKSTVYAVQGVQFDSVSDAPGLNLFPTVNRNNFCYVIIDPVHRICRCLYHAFSPVW